jgi:hypothetical protein
MSPAVPRRLPFRAAGVGIAAAVVCLALVGCQPEPLASPTASTPASGSPTATTASPTPSSSPTSTAEAGEEIALPSGCEQLYSPAMLAALEQSGPLNDPGVTMTSTQNVEALELLSSGLPTIRCSWGLPSESGMATNVTIVDAAQSAALAAALANAGFGCAAELGGTVCRFAESMINQDDEIAELNETHVLRGNAWVSSYTINFDVPGYTEDVVATLWG